MKYDIAIPTPPKPFHNPREHVVAISIANTTFGVEGPFISPRDNLIVQAVYALLVGAMILFVVFSLFAKAY